MKQQVHFKSFQRHRDIQRLRPWSPYHSFLPQLSAVSVPQISRDKEGTVEILLHADPFFCFLHSPFPISSLNFNTFLDLLICLWSYSSVLPDN